MRTILKSLSDSVLKTKYKDTNFITGLRFFCVILVLLIHTGGAGLRDFGVAFNIFVDNSGFAGVAFFFVISGFAIRKSFEKTDSYFDFIKARMIRVLPLYYLVVGYACINKDLSLYNIFSHFLMISHLFPQYSNSILSIEWSLEVEFFFYMILPLLLRKVTFLKSLLLVGFFIFLTFKMYKLPKFYNYFPLTHALPFGLGVLVADLRELKILEKINLLAKEVLLLFLIVILIYVMSTSTNHIYNLSIYFIFALILVIGNKNSAICKMLFLNKPVLFLGSISYSMYLVHLFFISEGFFLCLIKTITLSTLSCIIVENYAGKVIKNIISDRSR